ncbi:hypothetical protein H9P43_003546 [Blastocladiella emersonii ATCC 22665]|nr:hypothetical protein H9P43_003546 [Blastocladiella emersonii ATCC 22665]
MKRYPPSPPLSADRRRMRRRNQAARGTGNPSTGSLFGGPPSPSPMSYGDDDDEDDEHSDYHHYEDDDDGADELERGEFGLSPSSEYLRAASTNVQQMLNNIRLRYAALRENLDRAESAASAAGGADRARENMERHAALQRVVQAAAGTRTNQGVVGAGAFGSTGDHLLAPPSMSRPFYFGMPGTGGSGQPSSMPLPPPRPPGNNARDSSSSDSSSPTPPPAFTFLMASRPPLAVAAADDDDTNSDTASATGSTGTLDPPRLPLPLILNPPHHPFQFITYTDILDADDEDEDDDDDDDVRVVYHPRLFTNAPPPPYRTLDRQVPPPRALATPLVTSPEQLSLSLPTPAASGASTPTPNTQQCPPSPIEYARIGITPLTDRPAPTPSATTASRGTSTDPAPTSSRHPRSQARTLDNGTVLPPQPASTAYVAVGGQPARADAVPRQPATTDASEAVPAPRGASSASMNTL